MTRSDKSQASWGTYCRSYLVTLGGLLGGDEARQLATLLRDAPKPLLIHCRSGSDRTGLASAIYLNQVANIDQETAERQLSLRFGHIGIPLVSPTYAMDESWERLEKSFAPVPEEL